MNPSMGMNMNSNMNMNMNMMNMNRNFNENERNYQLPQRFPPPPQVSDQQVQMPMQRKRPLNPPDPPKFSEIAQRDEPPQTSSINPAYKTAIDEELKKMEEKFKDHLRDPESHPFYEKEWQLFWNRKADELTKRGKDPADYDFHDEWCEFFIDRIRELHDEEVKWKIGQLKRKFGVTNCDYPPLDQPRSRSIERNEPVDNKKGRYDSDDDDDDDYRRDNRRGSDFGGASSMQFQPDDFGGESEIAPWKRQAQLELQAKRRKPSRFDQPSEQMNEFIDHPKFREPMNDQFGQSSSQNFIFRDQNQPNPNSGRNIRPGRNDNMQNQYNRPDTSSRFMPDNNKTFKKSKKAIEKLLANMLRTIRLENVPLDMSIPEILDFFSNKFRGIVGCFRATDYVAKIPSKIVYIILMDEKEIEVMENLREIIMNGSYVRISSAKLLNGSAVTDMNSQNITGAPSSLFLTGLEKRSVETTFYLRQLAKFFDSQSPITGIRICHNAKLKKSRNFGFANFISKAGVDEFDGRILRMFDYEIRCGRTHKIPLLIHIDHADVLESEEIPWNNHVRGINLLNVDM